MKKGFKIVIVCASMLACACLGTINAHTSRGVIVKAEDVSEVVSEEVEVSEEVSEEKGIVEEAKDWVKKQWDTLIVPLLTGVSVTSVVTILFSVLFTIARSKAISEKYAQKEAEAKAKIEEIAQKEEEISTKFKEKMEELQIACEKVAQTLGVVEELEEMEKAVKEKIEDGLKNMMAKVDENNQIVQKYQKMEPILQLLVEMEIKLAKTNKQNITNGLMEDIEKISSLIKTL